MAELDPDTIKFSEFETLNTLTQNTYGVGVHEGDNVNFSMNSVGAYVNNSQLYPALADLSHPSGQTIIQAILSGGGGGGGGTANLTQLTQAQYDALEQAGQLVQDMMYFITDANGDGSQFQPVIYSTNEREIGVWIDGKPLYEITLETDTQVQLDNSNWTTIPWNNEPTDIDLLISAEIVRMCPNTNATMRFTLDSGHIKGASLASGSYPAVSDLTERLVIRYTKSTDTAGSGTWTPQGVPAHHYSTTEHVVGTWIDGSPVYEKSFSQVLGSSPTTITHGISNIDKVVDIQQVVYNPTTHANKPIVPSSSGFTSMFITDTLISGDNSSADVDKIWLITLRYTKTST